MKSFNDLDRLVGLLVSHRMPREQTLFMEIEEYNETLSFLKNLGSSVVASATLSASEPALECVKIVYAGYTFNIVNY